VLGLLLLRAGRLVPGPTLVADLWGDAPPGRAENSIQVHVSRLRRALPSELLVTRAPGYLIDVEPEQVDAVRFERAAVEAQERFGEGDVAGAAAATAEALAEWRGPVLPGAGYHGDAAGEVARLEELYLRTAELDAEARLALGRHAELVGELEALVGTHPRHEPFRGQLMLALYRSGRQADALDAYTRARAELLEQAGIDPGPDLQELQRKILLQDASLNAPAAPARPGATAPPADTVRKTVSAVYASAHDADAPSDPELHVAELDALAGALRQHGGTILDAPDGVVALFGVPQVREDDAVRAARGALACLDAVPGASVGIASGDALVEAGGGPHGPVVRDAARLAHASAPGTALLADATAAFLRDAAVTEPYTDRRGSLSAARLLELVPDAQPIARRHDLPLVGRVPELATLEGAFDRTVHERRCRLLTLLGEAGIGKSRLAQELRTRVEAGAATLVGRCPAEEVARSLQPLYEIVRAAAGEVSVAPLTALLAGEPDAHEVAEALCSALGAGETDEPPELFWAFRRLFETLARRGATVVFLEDLHWADSTLLDLVERLVDAIRDAPLLFVCLARPELLEQRPAWGGKATSTALLLEPLSPEESLQLIELRRFDVELPEETRAQIAERAEGNPLYIEQVLALLAEAGPEAEPSIPPSVHALIEARLDALTAEERRVLQHGAVAGREFGRGEIGLLLGGELSDECVSSLVRKELLAMGRDGLLRFRHGTIRDVAYSTLPKRDRARLHEALADWLEREDEDSAGPTDETIAYHLEQVIALRRELGAPDAELRPLRRRAGVRLAAAGRRAQGRSEARRAIDLLSRAAQYVEDESRAALLIDLAAVMRVAGEFEEATRRLDEASSMASANGDDGLVHKAVLGRLQMQIFTDLDLTSAEVVPQVEQAIAALERAGDDAGLAQAWYLRGWVAWLSCRADETVKALESSIRHAEAAGSGWAVAQGLHLLAGAYLYGPVPAPRAIERCEAVMEQHREQRRIVASTARALAGLYAMTGEFGRAHELIEVDRATGLDLGLRMAIAAAAELYGWVYYLEGRLEDAEAEYRRGLEAFQSMGERWSAATLAAGLAQVLHAQGRIEEAAATAEESRDNAPPDDLHTQIQWRGPYAKALALQGKVEAAQRIAQEAIVLARTTDFVNVQATALADLGETLRLAGDVDRAAQVTQRALALYEKKGNLAGAAALRAGL
jgi:DNA-binding SARP family transcriptional activator/tetratricopeptide (TPR) repeat protein